jgi:hypothetical protein
MDSPKTGLNVVNFVNSLLLDNEFSSDECSKVTIVTDEASNMNEFGKKISIINKNLLNIFRRTSSLCMSYFEHCCSPCY